MTVLPRLEERLTDAIRAQHTHAQRARRPRRSRRLTLVLATTLVFSATALAATHPWSSLDDAVDHGQRPRAPDRSLPVLGASGRASLAQFRGRVVVLSFFASWCGPCRRQASQLDRAGRTLTAHGEGTALLVNWQDSAAAAKDFVATRGLAMPVVTDRRGLLARDYDVRALPTTFVIDSEGRVVAISRQLATRRFLDNAIAKAQRPFRGP